MTSSSPARSLEAQVRFLLDNKTKPVGSLGRIEDLALQLALALGTPAPRLESPQMMVFAADHGIAAQGVSAYPSDVTWQMVENFLGGGAAVAVLARQHGLALTVVDCGVRHDFAARAGLIVAKVAAGSADTVQGPAMTPTQCAEAMAHGARIVASLPGNAILLGEMGIGNTSAAALLMARLTGLPIEACAGRGTGLDDVALARKVAILRTALQRAPGAVEPLSALADVGGLEIATLVGAILEATRLRRVIVVDGFICTAAVAVAIGIEPGVFAQCIFAHCSAESGHARWLERLGARPLLDLGLRLGEGSGAALAWPLLESACRILAEMASFESAGVSQRAD
jgi:nicotinate-nucleotide--dimethylbenzimidazole phosphoribosyltransferase